MGPWSVLGIESSDLCADTGQLLQVDRKFHRRWDKMRINFRRKAYHRSQFYPNGDRAAHKNRTCRGVFYPGSSFSWVYFWVQEVGQHRTLKSAVA